MSKPRSTFSQRFVKKQSKTISDDFPKTARIALVYLFADLVDRNFIDSDRKNPNLAIINELCRTARIDYDELDQRPAYEEQIKYLFERMKWWQIYIFCERIYDRLLSSVGDFNDYGNWIETKSLSDVRNYYVDEINVILEEENIAFTFADGEFHRRGRAQTQKNIQRVGTVLNDPNMSGVREHYNKARRFFDQRPKPDVKNCVKEALCALEACIEILTPKSASKDFAKAIRQLEGNDHKCIPSPIAQGMIKLYAYRGSGQGVAHAALKGSRVSDIDAELVLSLVASYITYLYDIFKFPEEDIPF